MTGAQGLSDGRIAELVARVSDPDEFARWERQIRATGFQDSWCREVVHVVPGWGLTV